MYMCMYLYMYAAQCKYTVYIQCTSVYCVILQAMCSVTVVYIQLFVRVHAQLNCTCTCIYIVGE